MVVEIAGGRVVPEPDIDTEIGSRQAFAVARSREGAEKLAALALED